MKNPIRFLTFFFAILFLSTTVVVIDGYSAEPIISTEVIEALNQDQKVPVLIKLKEEFESPFISKMTTSPKSSRFISRRDIKRLQAAMVSSFSIQEQETDIRVVHRLDNIPWVTGSITQRALDKLKNNPNVAMIIDDKPVKAALAESGPLINSDSANSLGYTGNGITVAVIDSGIDTDHPDLQDDLVWEECFLQGILGGGCPVSGGQRESGPGSAEDGNGHGTHVAGIITSSNPTYKGIAPDVGIVAIKVFTDNMIGVSSDVIAAIDWVISNKDSYGIRIINMSVLNFLSSGDCDGMDPAYAAAADAAKSAGITLFASSGNSANISQIYSPACLSSVIAVGAVYDANIGFVNWGICTDTTTQADQITCFSNVSPVLDLVAPGAMIDSSALGGGVIESSGTSMASPHAAGVAALMLQKDLSLTPDEIESILKNSGAPVFDSRVGMEFPRIDASAALTYIGGQPAELPRTGQSTCYNTAGGVISCAGTGQDGEIQAGVPWPIPRFTNNGDGTVTDNLTGLMWTQNGNVPGPAACSPATTKTWQGALDYVACLNTNAYLGYTDWRLPNVNELNSLMNAEQSPSGWLNTQGFSNVQWSWYWSSTSSTYGTYYTGTYYTSDAFWGHMSTGGIGSSDKSYSSSPYNGAGYYAWPVRSGQVGVIQLIMTGQTTCYDSVGSVIPCAETGQDGNIRAGVAWPSPRFADSGNGTVTDNLTGLRWTKDANAPGPAVCSPSTLKNWQSALDYVACLNANTFLGYTEWRLPNREELHSLTDFSQTGPALPPGHPFVSGSYGDFWSSTTYANYSPYAWRVSMSVGHVNPNHMKGGFLSVWPVLSASATCASNTYYRDADNDTYGNVSVITQACTQPVGYVIDSSDCNDGDASIYPGATEVCNGVDDNCNSQIDEGAQTLYYQDADSDAYGNVLVYTQACTVPSGYVSNGADCNDGNAFINPGAIEVCNLVDDNCNGQVDEGVQNTYYRDADSDTYGNTFVTTQACTVPFGYVFNDSDCNDGNASINPGASEVCNGTDDNCNGQIDEDVQNTYYRDADNDTYGNVLVSTQACTAPSGYVSNSADCNDGNASINPMVSEVCNGVDDNCNSQIDEGVTNTYYRDVDVDTYGDVSVTTQSCTQPSGYVSNSSDCNDSNASINPGAAEVCNGVDDNCNSQIDEGVLSTFYLDADADTYGNASVTTQACTQSAGYVSNGSDCNDGNASINPGASEVCNGTDDNCNGQIDEGVQNTYYRDADNDTYGNVSVSTQSCTAPSGYVSNSADCNDDNASINPGISEVCNGVDDNCNSQIDEGVTNTYYRDVDVDTYGDVSVTTQACIQPSGYVSNSSDCNDGNASINPAVIEVCNGVDDNCNSQIDEGVLNTYYRDADADTYGNVTVTTQECTQPAGYVSNGSDCNDANVSINPGVSEVCNGTDDNCNGPIDEGVQNTYYRDADNDTYGNVLVSTQACTAPWGYVSNSADCNDGNASINPGVSEVCNAVDDNCNSQVDEGVQNTYYQDADSDTYGNTAATTQACTVPVGYVANSTDCNDSTASVNPLATEVCNDVDDNCNGNVDEDVLNAYYRDADSDTFGDALVSTQACILPAGYVSDSTDCNDSNASINPVALEVCNGVDDNCNGQIDEGVQNTFHEDADGDTYGSASVTTQACTQPTGYVTDNTDCDDTNPAINPAAVEIPNDGIDQDCNGVDLTTTSKLGNISTRGMVQTGDNVMIGGFIISGTAPRSVLIRGFGPTLADFGVTGAMANPYIELYSGQTLIATNDDWQTPIAQCDAPAVSCGTPQDIQSTGKDACSVATTGCSQDAAILVTLPPGAYTAIMRGVGGGTGVGLVGVDDNDTSTLSRLVNISTRGPVLTGDSVMIGGFIVGGSSSKTVLIRGFGPTLTDFGVSGALANPYIELYSGPTMIATNDDWQTPIAQCDAPAVSCGTPQDIQATGKDACSVATTGCSQDAAILVTLPPGAYTAIMRGVSSGTGVGLVGIDEIGP